MNQTNSGVHASEADVVLADDLRVMLAAAARRRLSPGSVRGLIPPIDIIERRGSISVLIEVPGVQPRDLQVSATPRVLTIEGRKRREGDLRPDDCLRMERTFGAFARSVALPPGALVDYAVAVIADGVLEVQMPVVERATVLTGNTRIGIDLAV